ncbi:Uncharacterised protein [Neisseria meningitidis]|uniref:hypothetical protein n=1 Tax=Neisseria meningitidis TaxID=487 RepID=UPI000766C52B|nr:hypothetical protein [Neisseria meningitidis]CWM26054.1 Uncharacterised protein [Neisseria meningitidis]CWQ41727.1 Uncharacterised protein [Neisseria meningitidis]
MNIRTAFALCAIALSAAAAAYAKEIKIDANNTPYSEADSQKLAATAVGMGVKEPISLNGGSGSITVSGSSATQCVFKVGNGGALQIQGLNCK